MPNDSMPAAKLFDFRLPAPRVRPCIDCQQPAPLGTEQCPSCAEAAAAAYLERRAAGWFETWLSAVPLRFHWATEPRPALLAARCRQHHVVLARSVGTVALLGKAGAGKSVGAVALVSQWVRATGGKWAGSPKRLASFAAAVEVDELARTARLGSEQPEQLRRWSEVPLLVLDDLGMETTYGSQALTSLVARRHDADLATVFTSGLTPAQIGERYGAGVARRVLEAGALQLGGGT